MKPHRPFSHPPQTQFIYLETRQCKACWACISICPQHVFGKVDFLFHKHAIIEQVETCNGCLRCIKNCPYQAIKIINKENS